MLSATGIDGSSDIVTETQSEVVELVGSSMAKLRVSSKIILEVVSGGGNAGVNVGPGFHVRLIPNIQIREACRQVDHLGKEEDSPVQG